MPDGPTIWLKRIIKGGVGSVTSVGGLLAEGTDLYFDHLENKPDMKVIEGELRKAVLRMKTVEGNQNSLLEALNSGYHVSVIERRPNAFFPVGRDEEN